LGGVNVYMARDPRAALNLLWEWCGVAVTFFLMRRLVVTPADRRSLVLVVAATAISLSGLGIWQHYGGYSDSRRDYEKLKSEMASLEHGGRPSDSRAAVEWDRSTQRLRAEFVRMGVPGDESARMLWEQRLHSSEPIAMFALANTLGGVLACAAVVWLGLLVEVGRGVPRWQWPTAALFAILLLYCLLLTKSRTAFVGFLCGLAVWATGMGLWHSAERRRLRWWLGGGMLAAAGLVIAATASGGLDRLVVSESAKSLRYRFEYWQATWQMLLDQPRNWLLGVGPGNFRQNYLTFKLPQSSEEIVDPHNMVLDTWANGGILALAGLVGVCVAGLRPLWRGHRADPPDDGGVPSWRDGILGGGLLGYLAVFLAGGGSDERMIPLLLGWLSVAVSCRGMCRREAPGVVYAAAFAALSVHLLGAGGIGMPGIVQLMLLFVVLGSAVDAPAHRKWMTSSRWAIAVVGLAGLGLYLGCWVTGLTPVIAARDKLSAGEDELFEKNRPEQAERQFLLAAEADPLSADPYRQLSQLKFQIWLASEGRQPETFERSVEWQKKAIARDPRNSGGYRQLGGMYLVKFGRTQETADAIAAAEAFAQAVAFYPNQAQAQAGWAESLSNAGDGKAALVAARRACELDDINAQAGHSDKRLPPAKRDLMHRIVEEGRGKAN
jgi:hypothetical protein